MRLQKKQCATKADKQTNKQTHTQTHKQINGRLNSIGTFLTSLRSVKNDTEFTLIELDGLKCTTKFCNELNEQGMLKSDISADKRVIPISEDEEEVLPSKQLIFRAAIENTIESIYEPDNRQRTCAARYVTSIMQLRQTINLIL